MKQISWTCVQSEDSDEAVCSKYGMLYSSDSNLWVCCDECEQWYDLKCAGIRSKRAIPEIYICDTYIQERGAFMFFFFWLVS